MAYRFALSDRTIADGVRRIACAQIDAATAILSAPDRDTAPSIHGLRKHVKRLRGLIRIIKPGFPAFSAENAFLRDIGRSLADLRDSDVMIATLDALVTGPDDWPNLRKALTTAQGVVRDPAATAATLDRCEAMFGALRGRAGGWKIKGRGFATAADGLAQSHAAAAKGLARVRMDATDTRIHDWRKRVKDTQYQMVLITPIWPEAIAPRATATDALGEMLGLHHDLSVLVERAGAMSLPRSELRAITAAVRSRQDRIMADALPIGARLFAGKGDHMAGLWSAWWDVWRAGRSDH